MEMAVDVVSFVLMTLGGVLLFAGGVGILRLPDYYTRVHAAGLTDSGALLLVMLGLILQAGWSLPLAKLLAIVVFLLVTSPTSAYALANAALQSGFEPQGVQRWDRGEGPPR